MEFTGTRNTNNISSATKLKIISLLIREVSNSLLFLRNKTILAWQKLYQNIYRYRNYNISTISLNGTNFMANQEI